MKKILLLLLILDNTLQAQVNLPVPLNVQQLYKKGTRSMDGKPGKNYWQNTADYGINVNYDPVTRLISGKEEIVYTNNSPGNLNEIVFKLYPNLYRKGNIRDMPVSATDLTDGVVIEKLEINDASYDINRLHINGTNMVVRNVPVSTGQKIKFSVQYSYTLNKTSHIRTGEIEEGAAFIAYFFPRIAAYDDLDGWNFNPYTGNQEFYNDFCNFNVAVTVPNNYLVWATGDLQNCSEVLTGKYCERLQNAEKKDEVVFIVDENDLKQGSITQNNTTNTWRFSAKNVVDFAFAVSDHYVWNSSSLVVDKRTGRRTRVDAVFNTKHKDYFDVINIARNTVALMSDQFPKWPFPYNHETVFDGLDQMEYPMMVNDNPVETKFDAVTLTDHEIFHTMFPFYMGINETKYGWMDEGWATIGEWLLSPMIDSSIADDFGTDGYNSTAGKEVDMPVTTPTTLLNGVSFINNSYVKPGLGYLYAKDMLGDELFLKGLHFYIQQWNGKHPLPLDFFNCMNTGTGKNMNWFWQKWFYETGYPDLSIAKVINANTAKQIIIESKGNKPVPIDLTITFADNSVQKIHRSIAVWQKENKTVALKLTAAKKIIKVELGSLYVPDVNKSDNMWELKKSIR